jgi:protein-L-isoaspartate O-methyltransferase
VSDYYNDNASQLAATYESLAAARLHAWLKDSLPAAPACVLDIGAGSGRDAAWLASLGLDVVAVEPSAAMVREAQRIHRDPAIHWVEGDALPGLERTLRRGQAFDFILMSAVWIHVPPAEQRRAFRKIVSLLKPGGRVAITLRHGPAAPGQVVYDTSAADIEALCREHGAYVERRHDAVPDLGGRAGVSWTQIIIRLPDDGTGALPLLRQVILNDRKETTYKLALLRVLCRIAEGAAGLARPRGDDQVALPLGLVGLYWLRLFKPLLSAGFPQSADNIGLSQLGFVKDGYRALEGTSHLDLRIGMAGFPSSVADTMHAALGDAIKTIVSMPARYITHADGTPVFSAALRPGATSRRARPAMLRLDDAYLSSFGEFYVPTALWIALQRYTVWIEPAIEAEWVRLMQRFAEGQGRTLDRAALARAMAWPDPARDVRVARERALALIETTDLRCAWSDKRLTPTTLAMDHCLPFAVWSCDDLWNLLPVDARVNNRKSDRLPSAQKLRDRQSAILEWWQQGYCAPDAPALHTRFETEARASLPCLTTTAITPEEVFSGLLTQHLRLRHDQQAPVWEG